MFLNLDLYVRFLFLAGLDLRMMSAWSLSLDLDVGDQGLAAAWFQRLLEVDSGSSLIAASWICRAAWLY